jgi:hypothetical protein
MWWGDVSDEELEATWRAARDAGEAHFFVTLPKPIDDKRMKIKRNPDVWATVTNPSKEHQFNREKNAARPKAILKIATDRFGAWIGKRDADAAYEALERRALTDEECLGLLRDAGAVRLVSPDDATLEGWYLGGVAALPRDEEYGLRGVVSKLLGYTGEVVVGSLGAKEFVTGHKGYVWETQEEHKVRFLRALDDRDRQSDIAPTQRTTERSA